MTWNSDVLEKWWAHLSAVPAHPESWPYKRLRRIWHDHTMKKKIPVHPFLDPKKEVHLVATLFENFVIFSPFWIKDLDEASDLGLGIGQVTAINWGYEVWGGNHEGANCVDVAIHFRDERGDGVVVVEAKRPGGKLKKSDCDPGSYLNLKSFAFTERRALLYLVGDNDVELVKKEIIGTGKHRWAVLGWQELAGLQIGLVQQLPVDPLLRHFIAGAIQYQFGQHGFRPSQLSNPYLEAEPNLEPKLGKEDWYSQKWKLPATP